MRPVIGRNEGIVPKEAFVMMIHYERFFVVFGRHFSRLLINSIIMEGWECRSICSYASQKFADCATSPLPAILGVISPEIKVSCTADLQKSGVSVFVFLTQKMYQFRHEKWDKRDSRQNALSLFFVFVQFF